MVPAPAAALVLLAHSLTSFQMLAGMTSPLQASRLRSTRFVGGLLGVSADVDLCESNSLATIKLWGVPLGGTLRGTATFSDGEGSSVEIHEPLKTALRRRFVRVVAVRYDSDANEVVVVVRLPLLLGTHSLRLLPKDGDRKRERPCAPLLL